MPSYPLPTLLPLLLNEEHPQLKQIIGDMLKGSYALEDALIDLSLFYKIRVWFKQTVFLRDSKGEYRGVVDYTFPRFFKVMNDSIAYAPKRNMRKGYTVPIHFLERIEKFEPVIPAQAPDTFKNYNQFKNKFDLRFISEDLIKELWEGTSSQHGEKYKPSDFKRIHNKDVMFNFLRRGFTDIHNTEGVGYREIDKSTGDEKIIYKSLTETRYASQYPERNFTISHAIGRDRVHYSSEYYNSLNGMYGIVATEKTYLHLEND